MNEKYIPLSEPSCYVLQSIYAKPKHGYAIVQDIKQMSANELIIGNGTLYGILKRMEVDQLIETELIDNKKTYFITELGTKILSEELKRLNRIISNFKKINFYEG